MPVTLAELVGGGRAAVLTMELQRGVVGDLSSFPELAAAAQEVGVVANTARLLDAARAAGVPVVHCTAGFRPDRRGSPTNAPLIAAMLRRPEHLVDGTPAVELVPELGPAPGDLVSHRAHGVSPFVGTSLDPTLRALSVSPPWWRRACPSTSGSSASPSRPSTSATASWWCATPCAASLPSMPTRWSAIPSPWWR